MVSEDSPINDASDERIIEFAELVQEETEYRVSLVDEGLGDLCWFALDGVMVPIEEEEFDAEVDFNLSEDDVDIVVAEIMSEGSMIGRSRMILDAEATKLHNEGDQALYEYKPTKEDLEPLFSSLVDVHYRVFE
jgi:hypothetical protein